VYLSRGSAREWHMAEGTRLIDATFADPA
jgi:hypothetical protein